MSISLENYCEQIEALLLQGQTALAGVSIVRQDENSAARIDRIVVAHSPRETELFGPDGITPFIIRIPVAVTIHLVTRNVSEMDTILNALNSAQSSSAPAALTLASTAFPGGLFIRPTDTSSRKSSGNSRTESRTFDFIATLQSE